MRILNTEESSYIEDVVRGRRLSSRFFGFLFLGAGAYTYFSSLSERNNTTPSSFLWISLVFFALLGLSLFISSFMKLSQEELTGFSGVYSRRSRGRRSTKPSDLIDGKIVILPTPWIPLMETGKVYSGEFYKAKMGVFPIVPVVFSIQGLSDQPLTLAPLSKEEKELLLKSLRKSLVFIFFVIVLPVSLIVGAFHWVSSHLDEINHYLQENPQILDSLFEMINNDSGSLSIIGFLFKNSFIILLLIIFLVIVMKKRKASKKKT